MSDGDNPYKTPVPDPFVEAVQKSHRHQRSVMHDDAKLQESRQFLKNFSPQVFSIWKHVNGETVVVIGDCIEEANLEPCVLYSATHDVGEIDSPSVVWCRPLREFLNRFTPVA